MKTLITKLEVLKSGPNNSVLLITTAFVK